MFEVDGNTLDLRFNTQKIKNVEALLKISVMNELRNTQGLLSFHVLEGLFVIGLFDATEEKAVNGKKAQDIFESLLRSEGYENICAAVVTKLQEDLGFLFR
ncbi:segregation and condensation protein B [Amphibacillus sp. MSJ-3]|uniref:segregation and condensation protein B n=1 Tax=Amphibacillus sp. MSJ-3 TaxID=2841505 RepID=UPI001C0EDDA9|nr:segregation and condensation protein B [Amphibacillus sp. MSJ-3]MBU5594917.1 segregation and condensation protein B [Amphibacillus sp. MSJ-3]